MKIPEGVKQEIDIEARKCATSTAFRYDENESSERQAALGVGFFKGANYGFQKGYALAVERLRSEEAKKHETKLSALWSTYMDDPRVRPLEWAKWLEKQGDA